MKTRFHEPYRVDAVVPVNVLRKSKARLSSLLTSAQREALSVAMLNDTLTALSRARLVRRITIVSSDKSIRNIGRRFGATFVWEGRRRSLNKGVKLAVRRLARNGATAVLVIHADLPLLEPHEIDKFVEESHGYSLALAPSKDGSGTNALIMNPPEVISPSFGVNSFRRHQSLAKRKALRRRVLQLEGICFDIDHPRDLNQLKRRPRRNATGKFLSEMRTGS